jgi:hypothetical protein
MTFLSSSMLFHYRRFGGNYSRRQTALYTFIFAVFSDVTVFLCLQGELCWLKRTKPVISLSPIFYAFLLHLRIVRVGCSCLSPHSARPSATSFSGPLCDLCPVQHLTISWSLFIFATACLSCLFAPLGVGVSNERCLINGAYTSLCKHYKIIETEATDACNCWFYCYTKYKYKLAKHMSVCPHIQLQM